MASSNENLVKELRNAAEALRKQASEIRNEKPIVKQAGLSIDREKLKALVGKM